MESNSNLAHELPPYTIVERVQEGLVVITRVILDGEYAEFTKLYEHEARTSE